MSRFRQLGRLIAAQQDADRLALRATERSAASFIQALRTRRRPTPSRMLWAAALLLGALPLVAWWALGRAPAPLVQSPAATVSVGESIVVPREQTIPLHFSDGSRVSLASATRASVQELTPQRASVELERGKARVTIVHRADTSWLFRAGPYQVRVTGTKFELEWSPEANRFVLELAEGSVVVTTDDSTHAAVRMVAPEHLTIDDGVWQLRPLRSGEPASSAPAATQVEAEVQARASPGPARSQARPSRSVPTRTPEAAVAPSDWQSLAQQGKFAEAHARADAIGIESLSRSIPPAELLALAEVCRFSGHAQQAISVLTTLRQRFPARDEAAVAAFQLGRLFADGPRAADAFRAYLRERPQGALAREAAGRLLEVLDRSGDQPGVTAAAKSYLRRYPSGPHAVFARRVLGQ